MGLQFISKNNVGASAKLPLALPVSDGVVFAYLTYGSLDQLRMNYKNAVDESSVVGLPVVSDNKTVFTGTTNYIETGFKDTKEFTFFAVVNPIHTTGNAFAVGNYATSGSGENIYVSPANFAMSASYSTGSKSAIVPHDSKIGLVVASASDKKYNIYNKTNGRGSSFDITTGETRILTNNGIRVGSGQAGTGAVSTEIVLAIGYSRQLSSEEVDLVCAAIRKLTSSIGLTV